MEMDLKGGVTEADLEVRSVQLEIMRQRVADCEEKVNSALEKINFNFSDDAPMVQCPLDPRHYVPLASNRKHLETCKYIKEGIGSEEIKEFGIQAGCKGLVLIPNRLEKDILSRVRGSNSENKEMLQGILEERESQDQTSLNAELKASLHYSHEALQQRSTAQERSVLYDYAIMSNRRTDPDILAAPPDPFERLNVSGRKGEKESEVRIKGLRDSKRRRKTYKGGKGVGMRSLREETKSWIDLYMSNFAEEERSSSESESRGKGKKGRKRECEKGTKHKHEYKKSKKDRKKL